MNDSPATLSDEAFSRFLAEARTTIRSVEVSTKDVFDRVQKFSQLYGRMPAKPTGAALLFEDLVSGETKSFPLAEATWVGRLSKNSRPDDGCDLAFQDDQLSRKHFMISPADGIYLLRDLNSRNGTYVNDVAEAVHESLLKSGDIIFAGRMAFTFIGT